MTKQAIVNAQQKWECFGMTRKTESYLCKDLNAAGQEGWELVSVNYCKDVKGDMSWTAFLKRPFSPDATPPPPFGQIGMDFEDTSVLSVQQDAASDDDSLGFDLSGDSFEIAEETGE